MEAAARELLEETRLTATLKYRGIYHKMDYDKQSGELQEEFEGGRNAWLSTDEIKKLDKAFEGLSEGAKLIKSDFEERRFEYTSEQF